MDPNIRIAQELTLEHHHSDGSWSPMEPNHHESSDHDAERSWLRRRIFRCSSCNEEVAVTVGAAEEGDPAPR